MKRSMPMDARVHDCTCKRAPAVEAHRRAAWKTSKFDHWDDATFGSAHSTCTGLAGGNTSSKSSTRAATDGSSSMWNVSHCAIDEIRQKHHHPPDESGGGTRNDLRQHCTGAGLQREPARRSERVSTETRARRLE